jgi:endonuclease I
MYALKNKIFLLYLLCYLSLSGIAFAKNLSCPSHLTNQALLSYFQKAVQASQSIDESEEEDEEGDQGKKKKRKSKYGTAKRLVFKEVEAKLNQQAIETLYTGKLFKLQKGRWDDQINCEHVWPRSWMGDRGSALFSEQESDMHNLFPALETVNRIRGNLPYGEVLQNEDQTVVPSAIGKNKAGKRVFMPRAEVRGDIARTMFYFSMRWNLKIYADQEEILKKWSKEDPVSERERKRNDLIEKFQGNRNPFIDCPESIAQINDF